MQHLIKDTTCLRLPYWHGMHIADADVLRGQVRALTLGRPHHDALRELMNKKVSASFQPFF